MAKEKKIKAKGLFLINFIADLFDKDQNNCWFFRKFFFDNLWTSLLRNPTSLQISKSTLFTSISVQVYKKS